uniref:Defensin beta 126 n=1 Tax=Saimiri boliviensis boliviensis TaxID=39432 RepID=A0A2K6UBK7_SAIBB
MKSLLFTLAVFMLLAQFVSGNWAAKKCANKAGICKRTCTPGEVSVVPVQKMCGKESTCCVPVKHRSGHPSVCVEKKTTRHSTATTPTRSLMMSNALMSSMAATPVSVTS